jgi:hypothetical protein
MSGVLDGKDTRAQIQSVVPVKFWQRWRQTTRAKNSPLRLQRVSMVGEVRRCSWARLTILPFEQLGRNLTLPRWPPHNWACQQHADS